jgi:hypothetical protein
VRSLQVVCFSLLVSAPVFAQNELALKRAFEGREVATLIDMPASHRGVDLRPQREPEMEFSDYARRLKQFGISLRKGDHVMVTLVKVNKKNIEFHLGGGGYGTWGDDSGTVSLPAVTRSRRESDLERDVKREQDADRRRRLQAELDRLRRDREREQREQERRARELTAIKQQEVAVRRLDGGSRFNIWYDDNRLERWAPTPEELMFTMARYLEFLDEDGQTSSTDGRMLDPAPTPTGLIRRGMTTEDVREALGQPTSQRESMQGELVAVTETWETVDSVTEVTFVGGVVVRFSATSK